MKTERQPIQALMAEVGVSRFPARGEGFYERVMDEYEGRGCVLTDPAYYESLHARYGSLPHTLEAYKQAAVAMAKNEPLTRFLMLLCKALRDRAHIGQDLKELTLPHPTDYRIEYEMLTALAMCATADYTHGLLTARGLPQSQIDYVMRENEKMVLTYQMRHNGQAGAMSFDWFQLVVDAKILTAGRLEIELDVSFPDTAVVYANARGERVALAQNQTFHREGMPLGSRFFEDGEGAFTPTITETETAYEGYAYDEYGRVTRARRCVLPKAQWHSILRGGDPVVGLHIPPGGGLTPTAVEESLAEAERILAAYYPDYDYRGFLCDSWLMDRQLVDLMGKEANVSQFCLRFDRVSRQGRGRGIFSFVFLCPDVERVDVAALPERTALERALKAHCLGGRTIYETVGYIPRIKGGDGRC